MPGSPSPGGRKPGIRQIGQLVTRKGPEGSNPSPGAYFEEPGISLKALAGESRVEITTMDGLTANKTDQKKQTMMTRTAVTATDTSPSSDRLQTSSSFIYSQSFLQGREEVMVAAGAADDTTGDWPGFYLANSPVLLCSETISS
jgi:hypothetical protein